ncbi:aldose 1-epimerase [Dyadobacter sp. CY326]|uniref:aldose 1-epimerase n=1 Tax=Dyadobacter sp. CY326 TaxID=2907300 RepID=UPI001F1B8782|nr:aldose 1-epimerase [Dyadobacter sp. CY326]MCE7066844.1 aldose 1-epimerase [Dyadobacter sp. CY326]
MPFEISKQQFGDLTEIVLQDTITGNRAVIIPELGGLLRQLSLRKDVTLFSLLKTPPTPDALIADAKSASELLFPFASRIPDGKYKFLGKEYRLVRNETGNLNAIHGLVRKQAFDLDEQIAEEDFASLRLSYKLQEPEGYPFHVQFSVLYTLHADGRFTLNYEAVNEGTSPAPVMFGWHPYFVLGNETADVWKIKIPSDEIVDFDSNLIPIGKKPFLVEKPTKLYRKAFDNCFVINSTNGTVLTELISENQHVTLQIRQETGEGKFNYLVIYTPPSRDCVAIEPLTANVDSFNSGDGLNILSPGTRVTGEITLNLI